MLENMSEKFFGKKIPRRDLLTGAGVVAAAVYGAYLYNLPSTADSSINKAPTNNEDQKIIREVYQTYENIKNVALFKSLIPPHLQETSALCFTLASFYGNQDNEEALSYYQRVWNQSMLTDQSVAVYLSIIGTIKNWSPQQTLQNHHDLSYLVKSDQKIGAQLVSVGAAENDLSSVAFLLSKVKDKIVVFEEGLYPYYASAFSMSKNLNTSVENYNDISEFCKQNYYLAAKMSILSEYSLGDWKTVMDTYSTVTAMDQGLMGDENGALALTLAYILNEKKQRDLWNMHIFAKKSGYNSHIASGLTLLSSIKPDKEESAGRSVFTTLNLLANRDFSTNKQLPGIKLSIV